MADSRAEEWLKRSDRAFEECATYFTLCDALAEIFYPERGGFLGGEVDILSAYASVYDGNPIRMRWRLGNAIGAMSRGRGREWAKSKAFPEWLNKRSAVAAWNADTTDTQRALIYDPRAQFAMQLMLSDHDYVTFGTSPLKITENKSKEGVLFKCLHPASAAPEANSEGVIDITHERPKLTARVIGQLFPDRKAMGRAMREAIDKDSLSKIQIAQCIFPLDDYEPSTRYRPPHGATHVSLYLDPDEMRVIREEFFFSFPYVWRRWLNSAPGLMALSPCALVALADSRMSQDVRRTLNEAMENAADPAKMISAAAIEGNVDLAPGGNNFVKRDFDFRTGAPIMPVQQGSQPAFALEFANSVTEQVGQSWLTNLLTLPQDRDLTAYEASKLLDQDAREASPIFEPMEADNAAMMSRVFEMGDRWHAFAERPPELERAEVRFTFETPVSIALDRMRAEQGSQALGVVERFGALEKNFGNTEAYRRTNIKEVFTDMMRGIGPATWLASDEDADAAIEQDQKQSQMAQMLEMAEKSGLTSAIAKGGGGAPPMLPAPANAAPQTA